VRLEILRALRFTPRVLILDEPTSVLAPAELSRFLEMLRRLRGEGRIVILVTHKLAEALAVADDVTILRAGKKVAERRTAATDETELAHLMIGELAPQPPADLSRASSSDALALTLENIVVEDRGRRVLDSISLRIDQGEIVGVAGVDGNGQAELAAVLAGIVKPSSGSIQTAREDGVAVIPQNRDREGLILAMTLAENLLLARPLREKFTGPGGLMRSSAIRDFCAATLTEYAIRAPNSDTIAAALSGGNRQRLTVARALAGNPSAIVAHDISRGLDLRATAELHRRLRNYAAAGGAVLLISSDLEEIFALCRRIYVMSGGRLREISTDDRNPQRLGLLMSGAAS
jgi:simple sugar transport system ATP-binding protein